MDTKKEIEFCSEYTGYEMMLISASRQVRKDDVIFNAFHWPFLVAHIARLLHYPNLYNVIEIGITQDELIEPTKMPYSISDPVLVPNSLFIGDSIDVLSVLQRGEITLSFLSTSMIDKYGNCNTTVIGSYEKPIYRLPGGGGATEIAGLSKRLVWLLDEHTKRRFKDKLEYITDPGYLDGYNSRTKAGYPPDTGPESIISPLGIMRFDSKTKEAYLDSLHPNITIEEVKENTGWDLKVADKVKQIEPPTVREIEICRKTMKDAIDQYYILKPEWTVYLDK
ncbi:MAG: CoA-transferase subunit beta [Promethearchaeota archaeon]|jgi:glutaconate CoA-transferase subunit B